MTTTTTVDIAVPAAAEPPAPRRAPVAPKPHMATLALPPNPRRPAWQLGTAPPRDLAGEHLFTARYREADRFVAWLLTTRDECAARAARGHAYLSDTPGADGETVDLYRRLVRWVAWADACLWLLTHWYAQPDAAPRPASLLLPFSFAAERDGTPQLIVRELRGLAHEQLMEELLLLWRDQSILDGYLRDVWADAPEPEPA